MAGWAAQSLAAPLAASLILAAGACNERTRTSAPGPSVGPQLGSAGPGQRPDWLPADTPEQRRVLESSGSMAVRTAASPVYPALDRFAYATAPPFDPARLGTATQTVARWLEESPRLYVVASTNEEIANLVAQYGPPPPPEPDRWVRVTKKGNSYALAWATPGAKLKATVDEGNRALGAGNLGAASTAFRRAAEQAENVPALWIALAETLAAQRDDAGASQAARTALEIDARFPDAHRMMAEILARSGRTEPARVAIARALALYPASEKAWQSAGRIGRVLARPSPPTAFIGVGAGGAIHVVTDPAMGSVAYGACRALVRHEPSMRRDMLGFTEGVPYHPSVGEELFCLEAMLGAHRGNIDVSRPVKTQAPYPPARPAPADTSTAPTPTADPPTAGPPSAPPPNAPPPPRTSAPQFFVDPPPAGADAGPHAPAPTAAPPQAPVSPSPPTRRGDGNADQLLALAEQGMLDEYALFELIGAHRPEWLRVAPDDIHEAVVQYVMTHVVAPR